MTLLSPTFSLLAVFAVGALSYNITYTFPDCKNGPLKNNLVCDSTAGYYERADALVSAMNLSEVIAQVNENFTGTPRLGLPAYIWWSEALHGIAYSPGVFFTDSGPFSSATAFPNGVNLGASFDDDLYEAIGNIIANETRAFNNAGLAGLTYYSPINVNPFRDPRWGRGQEVPGEDVYHIAQYAKKLIPAMQGTDPLHLKSVATCKHFLAYDIENWHGELRYGYDAKVTTQDLVEFYLPTFKACVRDAKGASLMTSYNAVNGVPTSASGYFVGEIARGRWGFDDFNNYVTSDCDAVGNVYDAHNFTTGYPQAAALSMNAGTDLDCGTTYSANLQTAINMKLTTEGAVRKAVTRMYGALVRLGYFDSASTQPLRQLGWNAVNTPYAESTAYRAAQEGLVLLKNDGTLPLSPTKYKTVALVGPWGNVGAMYDGGQGGIYNGPGPQTVSLQQGLTAAFRTLNFAQGTQINTTSTANFSAALTAARSADVIIFAGGIDSSLEREAQDRNEIDYPGNQLDLVSQLAGLGKPLVVVQFGGGSVDNAPLKSDSRVKAILWAGYPGPVGGMAIADTLTGKAAPAGRLPYTQYPASYINEVPMTDMSLRPSSTSPGRTYKWYTGNATYTFGAGLHYTSFSAKLQGDAGKSLNIQSITDCAGSNPLDTKVVATIKASITNKGKVTSDYVAALYSSSTNGPAPHPKRELISYQRVRSIAPGKTVTATLPITIGTLSRIETSGYMSLYPGTYTLTLDNPDQSLAQTTLKLTGSKATIETWA